MTTSSSTSRCTTSPSMWLTTPWMPPMVTTSSPTSSEAIKSACLRRCLRWGTTVRKMIAAMGRSRMISPSELPPPFFLSEEKC
ncbi:MAG: hypothetical protein M5U19_10155 [Microthrixaceae bacterium]|nr:hypothetical protein [Microthrixaceae bacterium]